MRCEVWVLWGVERLGMWVELMRVMRKRGVHLRVRGVGGDEVRLGVVRLRLGGELRLQVKRAHVERRQRLVRDARRAGERVPRRHRRPVVQVGVRQQWGEGRGEHLREVGRGQMLGRVLLHVQSLSGRVRMRMRLCPGVAAVRPFLH